MRLEGGDGLDRLAIKAAPPRGNQFEERRFRQIEPRDRIEKGGGNGIGLCLTRIGRPFERVPPPLEADFAKQGLGDDFAHAGDFEAESIEGVNVAPRLARNEKAREPAVSILAAKQSLAIGIIRINWLPGHGGARARAYAGLFAEVAAGAEPTVSPRRPR